MPDVVVERRGRALWARITRPGRANSIDPRTVDELGAWLDAGSAEPDVAALVLTGSGRVFCAGADVRASAALGDPEARLAFLDGARTLVDRIAAAPVPVIAAVNGPAFAGGLELALACDLVAAAESAVIGDLHLPHGRIPGWGGANRLIRAVGTATATRMLLLGTRLTAAEGAATGWVAAVTSDDDLESVVDAWTATIAELPRKALLDMVGLLRDTAETAGRAALEREWDHFREHFLGAGDPGTVVIDR